MSDSNRSASVVEIKAPGTGGKQRLKVNAGGLLDDRSGP